MKIAKSILVSLMVFFLVEAREINIRGSVKDISGAPVSGAALRLENQDVSAVSESNGNFLLGRRTKIVNNSESAKLFRIEIRNSRLNFHASQKSTARIVIHSLKGEVLFKFSKNVYAGMNSVELPMVQSTGVYVYKFKLGNSETVFKNFVINGSWASKSIVAGTLSSQITGATQSGYKSWNDVIEVKKSGYLDYRVIITNPDTGGVEIKLIECAGILKDADGNEYQTVKIGNQVWTAQNLRTTRLNDRTNISRITENSTWSTTTSPAMCFYENITDTDSIKKYGALYNWYAVNSGKLAPSGWSVPDNAQWDTLRNYLITNRFNWDGTNSGNKIAKSMAQRADWRVNNTTGTTGWNQATNNTSGFSGLAAGARNPLGIFENRGSGAFWWSATQSSATEAFLNSLINNDEKFSSANRLKKSGYSVRLVKDRTVNRKGFITTYMQDNLRPDDAIVMRNGLRSMGYELVVEDTHVTLQRFINYLQRPIFFLYHTGHGSRGTIRMADGRFSYEMTKVAVENVWIATCHTGYPSAWRNQLGPTCKNILGYLDWTLNGPWYDEQAVRDFLANKRRFPGNSMAYVLYQTHWFNPYLNSKWAVYSRTSSGVVEYGSRTNRYPNTYSDVKFETVPDAPKCKVNVEILADETVFPGSPVIITKESDYSAKKSGIIQEFADLPVTTQITEKEAIRAAKAALSLPEDALLREAVVLEARHENTDTPTVLGYQVVFSRVVEGLSLKGTYFMDQISCFVNNKGEVTYIYEYWPRYTVEYSYDRTPVLSIAEAVRKALPAVSDAYKGDMLEIMEAYPVWGTTRENPERLFAAYALINSKGDAIVIDASDGALK